MCIVSITAGCEPLFHSSCSNESSITSSLPSERNLGEGAKSQKIVEDINSDLIGDHQSLPVD